jgi:hypothetical protein
MKTSQLRKFASTMIGAGFNFAIEGSPGIGKTQLIKSVCNKLDCDYLFFHLQYSDPTEVGGMPWVYVSPDGNKMKADKVPLASVDKLLNTKKRLVAILDDIGHATMATANSWMQPIEERRIGTLRLSDMVSFIALTNRRKDNAGAKDMSSTLTSRFHTVVEMVPDEDDLFEHAVESGWYEPVAAFIQFAKGSLFEPPAKNGAFCCPRSLDKLQQMEVAFAMDGLQLSVEPIMGCIGQGKGLQYDGFRDAYAVIKDIPPMVLRGDPDNATVPHDKAQIFAVATSLAGRVVMSSFGYVIKYLARCPKDLEVLFVQQAVRRKPELANHSAYSNWLVINHQWTT